MKLRIKEICDSKGIAVNSINQKIGISLPALYNIVNGKLSPKLETLDRIADALDVQLWELFTESTDKALFVALVKNGNDFYAAKTLSELENIVQLIKNNPQPEDK